MAHSAQGTREAATTYVSCLLIGRNFSAGIRRTTKWPWQTSPFSSHTIMAAYWLTPQRLALTAGTTSLWFRLTGRLLQPPGSPQISMTLEITTELASDTQHDSCNGIPTVTHTYNTPLICTLLLCQVVFLLCWALFDSSKHVLAMLSGFLLHQAFFFYSGRFFGSANHFLLC